MALKGTVYQPYAWIEGRKVLVERCALRTKVAVLFRHVTVPRPKIGLWKAVAAVTFVVHKVGIGHEIQFRRQPDQVFCKEGQVARLQVVVGKHKRF